MARRSQKLKFEVYMLKKNGEIVPWEELTKEEIDEFMENAKKRGSRVLSQYYTKHPEEFDDLPSIS